MHMQISTQEKKNHLIFFHTRLLYLNKMLDIKTLTKKKNPHQFFGLIGRIVLADVAVPDKVIVSWQIITKMYNSPLVRKIIT